MSLKIYKRGQGYYTRLWSALTTFAIVVIGCVVLWNRLRGTDNPWIEFLIPAGVCAAFGYLIFWLVNKPNVADFMIQAEGEIKKVSWSSKKEIVASTTIVICVVFLMAILLLCADLLFQFLLTEVIKAY